MSAITPALFLFTLVAVLLIASGSYLYFLRKRSNRHPVEKPSQAGKTMAPTREKRSK
jgi:hypothetical protein